MSTTRVRGGSCAAPPAPASSSPATRPGRGGPTRSPPSTPRRPAGQPSRPGLRPRRDRPRRRTPAALGFVVIAVDGRGTPGRGTPGRDKPFHDASPRPPRRRRRPAGPRSGLRQLALIRPWMDLDRVGGFGHSGGGFAAAGAMLDHPEAWAPNSWQNSSPDPGGRAPTRPPGYGPPLLRRGSAASPAEGWRRSPPSAPHRTPAARPPTPSPQSTPAH